MSSFEETSALLLGLETNFLDHALESQTVNAEEKAAGDSFDRGRPLGTEEQSVLSEGFPFPHDLLGLVFKVYLALPRGDDEEVVGSVTFSEDILPSLSVAKLHLPGSLYLLLLTQLHE